MAICDAGIHPWASALCGPIWRVYLVGSRCHALVSPVPWLSRYHRLSLHVLALAPVLLSCSHSLRFCTHLIAVCADERSESDIRLWANIHGLTSIQRLRRNQLRRPPRGRFGNVRAFRRAAAGVGGDAFTSPAASSAASPHAVPGLSAGVKCAAVAACCGNRHGQSSSCQHVVSVNFAFRNIYILNALSPHGMEARVAQLLCVVCGCFPQP